jgi:hypothetical protein
MIEHGNVEWFVKNLRFASDAAVLTSVVTELDLTPRILPKQGVIHIYLAGARLLRLSLRWLHLSIERFFFCHFSLGFFRVLVRRSSNSR